MALTDLAYSYDVDGQLTAIIDNLDPTKSLAINYDSLNRLVQVDQGTRRWLHSNLTDEPLAFESYADGSPNPGQGAVYVLYADRMGSISAVVDVSTGEIATAYDYDAFGQQMQFAGSLFQHYGYTARETDPESDLIYYRARYFDPATGRFLQKDPIGFVAGDLNLYAYVWNDPYNWTDPTGKTGSLTSKNQARRNTAIALGVAGTIVGCAATESCRSGVLGLAAAISDLLAMAGSGLDEQPDIVPAPPPDVPGDPNQCGPEGPKGPDNSAWENIKEGILYFPRVVSLSTSLGDNLVNLDPTIDDIPTSSTSSRDAGRNVQKELERQRRLDDTYENGRGPDEDC